MALDDPNYKPQSRRKQGVDKSVYDLALERIRYCYDLFDHIAVSFSGGKDSTAVLNMCLAVAHERNRLPLHVIFYDEEAIPMEVEDYVRRVSQRPDVKLDWMCIPLKHTNACSSTSTSWITWDPSKQDLWVRPMPPEAITSLKYYHPEIEVLSIPEVNPVQFPPEAYGNTCMMLGIRANESMTRFQAVSRRTHENYLVKVWSGSDFGGAKISFGNLVKGMPIYDWDVPDVWTAPAKFGWDYCAAYDMMEMHGIPQTQQRIAPPYGTQPMKGLSMFRTCFPDVWDKICRRVPGANTAAMYGKTELYAQGKIEKPEGITWQDWTQQLLQEVPDDKMRKALAKVILKYTNQHYKLAGNRPILPYVAHPLVGLTWELIARIIQRRDNKSRMRPDLKRVNRNNAVAYQKAWVAYDAAEKEYNAELLGLASDRGTRY